MNGLTNREIDKIVKDYIGVSNGYLGDFSYRTHKEFYPKYCDLDIDPEQYEGTTRQRFILVLQNSQPHEQAKIVRGVLERFPLGDRPETIRKKLYEELLEIIKRLENILPVHSPNLAFCSETVTRAIQDVENLIESSDEISGVDRIHTALHGYLLAVCDSANITYNLEKDNDITRLFKLIREQHPALNNLGSRPQDIESILKYSACILTVLNPIRNKLSMAHPNPDLLNKDEARLVINITRTLLDYFNRKFIN